MLRTELEDYRQLLQEYEQRTAEYEKELEASRAGTEDDEDPEAKVRLEQKFAALQELYEQLLAHRKSMAESRDAAMAS